MGSKIGLKMDPVLDGFWVPKSTQNGSKIGPKNSYVWDPLLDPVLVEFWGLWVPLGRLLGLPKALLGGLWSPKTLKNQLFFKGFCKYSVLGR